MIGLTMARLAIASPPPHTGSFCSGAVELWTSPAIASNLPFSIRRLPCFAGGCEGIPMAKFVTGFVNEFLPAWRARKQMFRLIASNVVADSKVEAKPAMVRKATASRVFQVAPYEPASGSHRGRASNM
jgi:hypothetical protein